MRRIMLAVTPFLMAMPLLGGDLNNTVASPLDHEPSRGEAVYYAGKLEDLGRLYSSSHDYRLARAARDLRFAAGELHDYLLDGDRDRDDGDGDGGPDRGDGDDDGGPDRGDGGGVIGGDEGGTLPDDHDSRGRLYRLVEELEYAVDHFARMSPLADSYRARRYLSKLKEDLGMGRHGGGRWFPFSS
ncbi:MAG: hypothetical protein HYW48_01875 [Deltaproteobacteria bacterium]|nr:hypothetical protein [Deltaproteobacteria bacterium]